MKPLKLGLIYLGFLWIPFFGCTTALKEDSKITDKNNTESSTENFSSQAHYHMGLAYSMDQKPHKAIEEYSLALMKDPDSEEIHLKLAAEYTKITQYSKAYELLNTVLSLNPKNTNALLFIANLHSLTKNTQAAEETYAKLLQIDPQNLEAIALLSELNLEANQPQKVLKNLKSLKRTHPSSQALYWFYKARAEILLNQKDSAIASLENAISFHPKFIQASQILGALHEQMDNLKSAIKVYQNIFDQTQDRTSGNILIGLYTEAKEFSKAVPILEILVALDPTDLNTKVRYGLILVELQAYEKAVSVFKEVLKESPDADRIKFYIAAIYEKTNQISESIVYFDQVTKKESLYKDAVLHSVSQNLKLKNQDRAIAKLQEGLANYPEFVEFYLALANIYEKNEEYLKSIEILENASLKFTEQKDILYYLGSLYQLNNQNDQAIRTMELILDIDPNHVDALNFVGFLWTQQKERLTEAERLLTKARSLSPQNGYIEDSWGWYLYTIGETKAAVSVLENAVQLTPDEPSIRAHLADAYLRMNLVEKAIAQYQKALKLFDKTTDEKKTLEEKLQTLLNDRLPAEENKS